MARVSSDATGSIGFSEPKCCNCTLQSQAAAVKQHRTAWEAFADPDTFGHHSTSYFPTSILQQVVIDRSPGGATDLGYASFGGSVNVYSETIPEKARVRAFATYGSFNTFLIGTTLNTAQPRESGQTGVIATAQYSESDGAMTYSAGYKDDIFLKTVTLLGDVAKLTAVYSYDHYRFYNPGSLTSTDLAEIGSSVGFNNDPTSPNYYKYASTVRSTDFGYLRLEAQLADTGTPFTSTPATCSTRVEAEGHVILGAGITALANASLIRATYQQSNMTSSLQRAGDTVPFAPDYTGLAGLVYARGPWNASLLTKFVGREYQGKNGSADGNIYKVKPYSYTNATATRNVTGLPAVDNLRLTLGINNLFNSHAVTDNAGYTAAGPPGPNLVNVLARTSFTFSAVADF